MENKEAAEKMQKLMSHCCGCPYVGYGDTDTEGFFYCSLLKAECEDKHCGSKECEDCVGSELMAVVKYNKEGEVIDFNQVNEYPESCVREQGAYLEVMPDVVHHYIFLGDMIIRESFLQDKMIYYFLIENEGEWVIPVLSRELPR